MNTNNTENTEEQNRKIDMIKHGSIFVWTGYFILLVFVEFYLEVHIYSTGVLSVIGIIIAIFSIVATFIIAEKFYKS